MTIAFLQARITATENQIIAYEDAITAVGIGGIQSYTLDTGQSRQNVTKLDITNMQKVLNGLYNQLTVMENRLTGAGTTIGRPGF